MKIDTNEIDMEFTTQNIDGLVLVNPREIGIEIANQHLDDDVIYQTDIYNYVEEYLIDIIEEAVNTAYQTLKENNRSDIL